MFGHFADMMMRLRCTYGTEQYYKINARMIERKYKGVEVIDLE